MPWVSLGLSFLISVAFVPLVRWLSYKTGKVAKPRKDRWHNKPTPTLGGIAIFLGFLAGALVGQGSNVTTWIILMASTLMFLVGILDDFIQLSPPAKLISQILAAALVVFVGYRIKFFNYELLNILLTFVWLVGITNAINLLDNMDGLAGGTALIVAIFLSFFFSRIEGQQVFFSIALAMAGSILGFLLFNFPPASIFMGDSGSQFIGFTLASLAVARRTSASNVFAVLGIPTLLFLIPILDTSLVTITRILRGQSPTKGGKDHTSHRLIAFGLTERQTVLVLYGIALISGIASTAIETLDYDFSLLFVPVLIIALSLLAAYLGRLKVVPPADPLNSQGTITRVVVELTYRQRIFEVILDFFIISIAYYLALWTQFDLSLSEYELNVFLRTLPVALFGGYISFFIFGVYRGVWEYLGVQDLIGYLKAVIGSVAITGIGLWLMYSQITHSAFSLFLFGIFLFLGLAASRSSFRVLDQIYSHQTRTGEMRVLVYGAGNAGEMAVRWMLNTKELGYLPVGFLDDDPYKWGRMIHGIKVVGGKDALADFLHHDHIDGLILTPAIMLDSDNGRHVISACKEHGLWVRRLRLDFELIE